MRLISESLASPEKSPLKKTGSPRSEGESENYASGRDTKISALIADDDPIAREALRSLLDQEHDHNARLHEKIDTLIASLRQEPKGAERMAIKSGGRIIFLRLADIDWIEAADNYVNLHAGQDSHLFRETMNGLEARLSPKRFVRISRSAMVNIEQIKELQPMSHGEYVVVLRNGMRLTLTRGYREKMRELSLM
jgi:hypothetical protein